jgi:hypothetical protein
MPSQIQTRVKSPTMLTTSPPTPIASRSGRISPMCEWCGTALTNGRADQRFCCGKCRRDAWAERAHFGHVASVRRLKSGLMSITVHMPDVGLCPRDRVCIKPDAATEQIDHTDQQVCGRDTT